MKVIDILLFSLKNLSQRRLRSWLTIIGIVIGTIAIVSMLSIGKGLRESITSQLSLFRADVIMIIPGTSKSGGGDIANLMRALVLSREVKVLTDKDINVLKRMNEVEDIEGVILGVLQVKFGTEKSSVSIRGVSEKWIEMINAKIKEGRNFFTNERKVAILGYRVANEMFSKKISVGSLIEINGNYFKVIGILEKSGLEVGILDNSILIHVDDARDILNVEKGKYSLINVKIKDISKIDEIIKKIDEELMKEKKENQNTKSHTIISSSQIAKTINEIIFSINLFLTGIAAISLIVGAIGIVNTMFTSVLERTKQIGTLKALGAKNSEIMLLFLFEAMIIGFIGSLIGIFCSFIIIGILDVIGIKSFYHQTIILPIITLSDIFIGIAFGTVIGILAGLLPAKKAASLEPVDALRYE